MGRSRHAISVPVAVFVTVGLAVGACGGNDDGLADEVDRSAIIPNAAAVAAAENATPEPIVMEGDDVGSVYELVLGDCFNIYQDVVGEDAIIRDHYTHIECSRAHDAEIYAAITHPSGAELTYPGRSVLSDWAQQQCYEAFEPFVGVEYEYSDLELAAFLPEQSNWDFGPYRTVTCYVHAPDSQLAGSMAGTRI